MSDKTVLDIDCTDCLGDFMECQEAGFCWRDNIKVMKMDFWDSIKKNR